MVRPLEPDGNRSTALTRAIPSALILFVALLPPVASTAGAIPDNPRYLFEPIGDNMGLATRGATTMHQDRVGFIWIGTQDGLFRYDGAQVKRFSAADGAPWAEVNLILESPDGDVWVVAEGGVSRFDGLGFESLNIASNQEKIGEITLDISQPMAFDRLGQIYLATNTGLAVLDPTSGEMKRNWAVEEGFPSPIIRAVHVAPDGLVWFAAGSQVGWLRPESGKVELFDIFEGIPNEDIIAILANEAGTVWVRTRNNLLRMDPGASSFTATCDEIAEAAADGMPSLDHAGNILVPTRIGLLLQDGDGWERLSAQNGLRVNTVWSVLEDRDGSLWIGLGGAGVSWSPGRGNWSAWTSREGLPDDGIWGIIRDPMDRLWVGTNQGVGIWLPDEARWKVLTKDDGIFGDSVWKLVLGNHGEMWILSRRLGITRIDLETLATETVNLPKRFVSGPTDMVMGPEGNLWVGGNQYLLEILVGEEELIFEEIPYPEEITGCTEVIASGDSTARGGSISRRKMACWLIVWSTSPPSRAPRSGSIIAPPSVSLASS
jgi:ligand-binding sensor domain-containing protein